MADGAEGDGKVVDITEVDVVDVDAGAAGRVVGPAIEDADDQVAGDPVAADRNRADLRSVACRCENGRVVAEDGSALDPAANRDGADGRVDRTGSSLAAGTDNDRRSAVGGHVAD